MGLVLRRVRTARSLLSAAVGATLVCTVLLTGTTVYALKVLDEGARNAVGSATRAERSVLVRAPLDPARFAERDAAVRARTAPTLGGVPTDVRGAGYASGRQFAGDTGTAVADADNRVYAAVVFLDGLDQHADLVSGTWPEPGAAPVRTALGEAVAATLGVRAGETIPLTDRFTGRVSDVVVSGIWRPRHVDDPYWQLFPDVAEGVAPRSSTYGPLVVDRADFLTGFAANASAGWVVQPALAGAPPERLDTLAAATVATAGTLPAEVGFGTSATVTSQVDVLVQRLHRADLVGRSTLVTPMLLLVVLGGYTLLLVALLLGEQRNAETALLRARGASRRQLAALSAREAALIVVPAVLLAPWAAQYAVHGTAPPDRYAWTVAAVAGIACGVAMLIPALRSGGTYVAAMAGQSRPGRRAAAQRAGLDIALVALAALGWLQLRQYSSPVAGSAGGALRLDPLLAAAPTLGVLAGAAVGLRVLPLLTGFTERRADRRAWVAGTFGMWQAGRRAHAGSVLLLALAVAVSTLAWCLTGTAQRSVTDQAAHVVGADLRVTPRPATPIDPARLAALPGVRAVLPVVRERLQLGPAAVSATMVALDAGRADGVVQVRADLADGDPRAVLAGLAAGRAPSGAVPLPSGPLTGTLRLQGASGPTRTAVVLESGDGEYRQVPLRPGAFTVDLPASLGPQRLAGFVLSTTAAPGGEVQMQVTALAAGGGSVDLAAPVTWRVHAGQNAAGAVSGGGDALTATYRPSPAESDAGVPVTVVVSRVSSGARVPVVGTDAALSALRLRVGDESRLRLGPYDVDVRVTGALRAVPGTTDAAALLVDLPSLSNAVFLGHGAATSPGEWWLSTVAGGSTAAAATALGDVQDRRESVRAAGRDPYGRGARNALFAAALGAVLLAGLGLTVDVRATARRRAGELAVLHTLGAGPRLLAASLVTEQAVLAAVGLLVGVLAGIGVAATLAPLVILTAAAGRPVPPPVLDVPWWPIAAGVAGLAALSVTLSALTALTVRRSLIAGRMRIGGEG